MTDQAERYGRHSIKVSDETYLSLKVLKGIRKARKMSFDDVLDDLIDFYLRVGEP